MFHFKARNVFKAPLWVFTLLLNVTLFNANTYFGGTGTFLQFGVL